MRPFHFSNKPVLNVGNNRLMESRIRTSNFPTMPLPTSNCGLIKANIRTCSDRFIAAGSNFLREINDASQTISSRALSAYWLLNVSHSSCVTVTRGLIAIFSASCLLPTSTANTCPTFLAKRTSVKPQCWPQYQWHSVQPHLPSEKPSDLRQVSAQHDLPRGCPLI